jgi:DNA-directed RNA polymerase subunit E'/Rpb7
VIEEPAHAAAATVMAFMAVEAERMTAVVTAVAAFGVMVEVSSKHVVLDPVSLYRSYRYIGFGLGQERFSIYLKRSKTRRMRRRLSPSSAACTVSPSETRSRRVDAFPVAR